MTSILVEASKLQTLCVPSFNGFLFRPLTQLLYNILPFTVYKSVVLFTVVKPPDIPSSLRVKNVQEKDHSCQETLFKNGNPATSPTLPWLTFCTPISHPRGFDFDLTESAMSTSCFKVTMFLSGRGHL